MATVWLADDDVLGRDVAVKVMSSALAGDEAWLARFKRESRLAAGLQHPNLVSIYDFDASGERPFLVMEHMPGGSLSERIAAAGPPETRRLALDLLGALVAVHDAGIVHRDVKPGNVLFDARGAACLTDFGVARPEDATSLTQTGHIPGTARYMAPELWKGHPADERTDLYAAGVLLGKCADDRDPPEIHRLIASLADEEPGRRPRSAAEALALFEAQDASPAGAPEVPTRVLRTRRFPLRPTAVGALALTALVAGIVIATSGGGGGGPDLPTTERQGSGTAPEGAGNDSRPAEPSAPAEPAEPETATTTDSTGADPESLNAQGFTLIQDGQPGEAIPLLEEAVGAYPEGSTDLGYAYALYNLATALHLDGRSREAIPLLKERLRIPNQRDTVLATLAEVREAVKGD